MRKAVTAVLIVIVLGGLTLASLASAQNKRFITVEGADLRAKLKEALRLRNQSRSAKTSWVAYSFDVKPGMAIDAVVTDSGGQTFGLDLATGSLPYETRNVAVFLMYAPDGRTVERGELYNLDRRRDYEGYPVYWLGRAGIEESLSLLQDAVLSTKDGRSAKRLTEAVAVHNHRSSETALKNILYSAADERARMTAITWLGRAHDGQTYLIEAARDERLGLVLRERAVAALVENNAPPAVLQTLYGGVNDREVRSQIIRLSLKGDNKDEVAEFLSTLMKSESDPALKSEAISKLRQTPGPRSLSALSEVAESPAESAEMQIEAVRAIGLSDTEGAVPTLIRIAKSHPSARVRQEAVRQLGRRNEESAQKFLRELGPN